MSIIIVESIGFCATNSISELLRINGKNLVSHGTKNFQKNTQMGIQDLTFHEFYCQMISKSEDYENCISVHSNFNPRIISNLIEGSDTKFWALMRKKQKKQVLSCFYWAINGFLNGRKNATKFFTDTQKNYGTLLEKIGLSVNMKTCLALYSFQHVVHYNLLLSRYADNVFFMEDFIDDPTLGAKLIGATDSNLTKLKVNQGPSHKAKVKEYEFLFDAEGIVDHIFSLVRVSSGETVYTIEEIEKIINEKSAFNR
jgi:hypothetical protein